LQLSGETAVLAARLGVIYPPSTNWVGERLGGEAAPDRIKQHCCQNARMFAYIAWQREVRGIRWKLRAG